MTITVSDSDQRPSRTDPPRGATARAEACGSGGAAAELLDLLGREAAMYAKLESYAGQQRSLITREDTGPLLDLLADRQTLSTELARVSADLTPFRRNWPSYRRGMSAADRAEAERLFGEVSLRLGHIMEVDEQDARLLEARKQAAGRSLRAGHSAGVALAAYGGTGARPSGGRRLDKAT